MNQEKIGKFIAELRKEKNMTQLELANKLGVTDRAISNWENGRRMPDLSLIKSLCNELNISINELLSGEKLNKKSYQEKLEENIINTINFSDKKIKKTKNKFKLILVIILSLFISLLTLFYIDISRMKNNEPVLFSTWGFNYAPPIDLHEEEIAITITEYLLKKNDSSQYHNNEKWFVSFKTYLIEERNKELYNVYAWVLEESYYLENDEIKQESGASIPHKFIIKKKNNKYIVTNDKTPRDGSLYNSDMKKIFPLSVRNNMDKVYTDGTVEKLKMDINQQIKLYFHN